MAGDATATWPRTKASFTRIETSFGSVLSPCSLLPKVEVCVFTEKTSTLSTTRSDTLGERRPRAKASRLTKVPTSSSRNEMNHGINATSGGLRKRKSSSFPLIPGTEPYKSVPHCLKTQPTMSGLRAMAAISFIAASNSISLRPNSMDSRFLFVGFKVDSSFFAISLYSSSAARARLATAGTRFGFFYLAFSNSAATSSFGARNHPPPARTSTYLTGTLVRTLSFNPQTVHLAA